jgi:histidyl-tRNA synthetase
VLRALDKWDKVGAEGVRAELLAAGVAGESAARVLAFPACAGRDDAETLGRLESLVGDSARGREGVEGTRRVLELLRAAGVPGERVRVDPTIARGLDYYTGVVFEVGLEGAPEFGSVGAGGRYDDLASLYTNQRLPGVGCSVGISRLIEALDEQGKLDRGGDRRTVLVVHPEQGDARGAFALAAAVRRLGFCVETYPEPRKHAAQMKYADRKGLRFALTLDPDGHVHGKDLRSGEVFEGVDAATAAQALATRAAD